MGKLTAPNKNTRGAKKEQIWSLDLCDVFARKVMSGTGEDYDHRALGGAKFDLQSRRRIVETEYLTPEVPEDGYDRFFRVSLDLGIRWGRSSKAKKARGAQSFEQFGSIEAILVAEYIIRGEPTSEERDRFAFQHSIYHVWPYWRDFVAALSSRMNSPGVVAGDPGPVMNSGLGKTAISETVRKLHSPSSHPQMPD